MKTLHTKVLLSFVAFAFAIVLSGSSSFAQTDFNGISRITSLSINIPHPSNNPPMSPPPNPVPHPDPLPPAYPVDTVISPGNATGRMNGGTKLPLISEANNDLQLTNLAIYPNPSNGQFSVNFNSDLSGDMQVRITDILGKEIFYQSFGNFTGDFNQSFDLTGKGKGIYILSIEQNNKLLTKKIVVS